MRYSVRLAMPVLVAVAIAVPLSAHAVVNPIIDFDGINSYACETNGAAVRAFGDHDSNAGDTLRVVGKVIQFNEPFDDLDPLDPAVEYTYEISGVSLGTVTIAGFIKQTDYTDARVRIYSDAAKNADFADKSTFTDGTLILEGTFTVLRTTTRTTSSSGSIYHDGFAVTGGTLAGRLNGCTGTQVSGGFSVTTGSPPSGYFGWADTKLDVECPVATEPSTWGSIKNRYP